MRETRDKLQNGDFDQTTCDEIGKWRKLEMPIFSGEDACGWIHKMNRYFTLRGCWRKRMEAEFMALDGDALSWFQWLERCNSIID